MSSLQDQLLKAGMVDAKKASKVAKDKRKQNKVAKKSKVDVVDDTKLQVEAKRAEKAERDRQLNQERLAAAEKKAIAAQIKQIIDMNRVDKGRGEVAFSFVDGKSVKKMYVTDQLQAQLSRGQLAIVKQGGSYELVPAIVAEKIAQRDDSHVLLLNTKQDDVVEEDDPYADYQIPDDLMW